MIGVRVVQRARPVAKRPARSVAGPCHREERSDVATSMTERVFMGVATSLRSSR
jgi:hypothetical protein